MIDDIPEATREATKSATQVSSGFPRSILIGGLLLGAIAVGGFWLLNRSSSEVASNPKVIESTEKVESTKETEITPEKEVTETTVSSKTEEPKAAEIENILGHLPYEQAQDTDLVAITADGRVRLRHSAAAKFREMEAAARSQGIKLAIISGFRTLDDQDYLFFGIKEQRVQDASKRAEVSAPPGHSEHHTGYAVDVGDANVPATHLSEKFENTAAFMWLEKNAPKYSFELSFPRDNPQGISYEPWHWRFVGDRDSLETFYKARNLKGLQ